MNKRCLAAAITSTALLWACALQASPKNHPDLAMSFFRAHSNTSHPLMGPQTPQEKKDFLIELELARVLSWDKRYDESLAEYQHLLDKYPENVTVLTEMAKIYDYMGNHAAAQEHYTKAMKINEEILKANPNDVDAHLSLARIYNATGHLAEAEEQYKQLIKLQPNNIQLLLDYGQTLAQQGKEDLALQLYQAIFSEMPAHQGVSLSLVRLYLDALMPYKAVALCQELLDKSPNNREARYYLAVALGSAGEYAQAMREVEKILADDPSSLETLSLKARLYLWQHRYYQAIEFLTKQLSQYPDNAEFSQQLADSYTAVGEFEKSNQLCRAILETHPRNEGAEALLVKNLLLQHRDEDAKKLAQDFFDKNPDSASAKLQLGFVLEKDHQLKEAATLYKDALLQEPNNTWAAFRLSQVVAPKHSPSLEEGSHDFFLAAKEFHDAEFLQGEQQDQAAIYACSRAIAYNPDSVIIQLKLAEMLALSGYYESSENMLYQILGKHPTNDLALYLLANAYSLDNAFKKAEALYALLIARDPSHEVVRARQARVLDWDRLREESAECYAKTSPLTEQMQEALALESKAKRDFYNKFYIHALKGYDALIAMQPENSEGWFDKGQILGTLGDAEGLVKTYTDMLDILPWHHMARETRDWVDQHLAPSITADYFFNKEYGRDDLKNVQVNRIGVKASYPLRHINHTLTLGAYESFYKMSGMDDTQNFLSLRVIWDYLFSVHFYGKAWVHFDHYYKGFEDSRNWGADFFYRIYDRPILGVGCRREDIRDNTLNFLRRYYVDTYWGSFEYPVNARLTAYARYGWGCFSDHNQKQEALVSANYQVSFAPHEFYIQGLYYYYNVHEPTISTFVGNDLVSAIHPYWAPDSYWAGYLQLHWRHLLTRHYFADDQPVYYELKSQMGLDNASQFIQIYSAKIHWDITSRWRFDAEGAFDISAPYHQRVCQVSLGYYF